MNSVKKTSLLQFLIFAILITCPLSARTNNKNTNKIVGVVEHFPANMATDIALDAPITAEFGGNIVDAFYETVDLQLFDGIQRINGELFYNPSLKQIMFKPSSPFSEGQTVKARLTYNDGLGNTAEETWTFQTSSPFNNSFNADYHIASENQLNNSTLFIVNTSVNSGFVNTNSPLELTFSEPLDIASLKNAPIQLFENNQPIGIDYKLSRDMKTITITPRSSLSAKASYAITIDQKLSSNSGGSLSSNTVVPFSVGSNAVDVPRHVIEEREAPPENTTALQRQPQQPTRKQVQINGLVPQNGSKVTNLSQPITISFTDEIKPETLNEFTFRLEDDFGPVPAHIHYFEGQKQATLTPIGLLDSNKNYRIIVTQGVSDLYAQPIRTGITSMFATRSSAPPPPTPEFFGQSRNPMNPADEVAELQNMNYNDNTTQQMLQQQPALQNNNMPQQDNNPTFNNTRQNALSGNVQQTYARVSNQMPQNYNQPPRNPMQPADNRYYQAANLYQEPNRPFEVDKVYPQQDSTNVPRQIEIAAFFTEAANPSTLNTVNFSIFGNQKRVEGQVIWDEKNNRAIFKPTYPLFANTAYRVIINDKIKSKKGEQIESRYSWDFTTGELRQAARQQGTPADTPSSFYIPLEDVKGNKQAQPQNRNQANSLQAAQRTFNGASTAFNFVPSNHWSFTSLKHLTDKKILNAFPFAFTENVTRYEFASAINTALSNLRSMQYSSDKPKLRSNDLIELQKLIIEFRIELKSYNINTQWFESFLMQQGVNMNELERHVRALAQG